MLSCSEPAGQSVSHLTQIGGRSMEHTDIQLLHPHPVAVSLGHNTTKPNYSESTTSCYPIPPLRPGPVRPSLDRPHRVSVLRRRRHGASSK